MTEELVKNEVVEIEGIKIMRNQVELIKRTIFIGATDDELRLFFYECARRGTHPMDRLIYPVVRKDKDGNRRVTFQTGIDYLRAAGEETGRYMGQDPFTFGPIIKQKIDGGEIEVPEWAEATVKRKDPETGEISPVSHRVYWKEFYPGEALGFMWRKMPHGQLGKCAEAGAFRKGFPRKLGGLYVNEEMEQAEAVPFGTSRPELKEPQKKANGEVKPQEPTEVQVLVKDVTLKTGKGDKGEWTLYKITTVDDLTYQTFNKDFGEIAVKEKSTGMPIIIEFKPVEFKGKDGKTIQGKEIVSLTRAEALPPEKDEIPF